MESAGMYTTESRKSILTKVRLEHARAGFEADEHWGDFLDGLDVFNYHSESWLGQILKTHEVDKREWRNPAVCRQVCLYILARQSVDLSKAVSLMLRNGMNANALSIFANLYEARADAEFIRLDTTGLSATRWLRRKLTGDGDLTAHPKELTEQRDLNIDRQVNGALNDSARGHWAETPDGKTFAEISARSQYVNRKISESIEEWPLTIYSPLEWDGLLEMTDSLFHQASTPSHPVGNELKKVPNPPVLIIASTVLTSRTLLAYRTVADEFRARAVGYDEDVIEIRRWAELKKCFNSLRVESVDVLQPRSADISMA